MKQGKLSSREKILLVVLGVLLVGIIYYTGFYTPLQNEMADIQVRIEDTDAQIAAAQENVGKMDAMQEELDEILAKPKDQLTEIAPYDNKEVVLNMLNGILKQTQDYSLSFSEPSIQEDGTVRRAISMGFSCENYQKAKAVLRDLSNSPWRSLISNVSISGGENVMEGNVSVAATVTFFESTQIS